MAMNTPFGEWLPDQPDNTSGVTTAKNVIPAARGYRGLQDLSQYSNAADNRLRGIFAAKDDSGVLRYLQVMLQNFISLLNQTLI